MSSNPLDPSFRTHLNPPSLINLREEAEATETLERQPLVSHFLAPNSPMGPVDFDLAAEANKIYRFIVGADQGIPKQMSDQEIEDTLQDSFANLALRKGQFPLTADGIVKVLQATGQEEGGLEKLRSFVIAEGGQIEWSENTSAMNRAARLVLVVQMKGGIGPDVMISTGTQTDSETGFLQLMSWDPENRAYNFYQRLRAFWIYSGNSFHALEKETRGKGPFSGHINGGPIMKELKVPWQHWESQSATIQANAFNPNDSFTGSPYFLQKEGAETFEIIVKSGINHWNESRIARAVSQDTLDHPEYFLRQILETKNVNLISSLDESNVQSPFAKGIRIPFSFFANFESLGLLGVNMDGVGSMSVDRSIYRQSLEEFDFALESNGVKVSGDTHFAFFVPEVAEEDIDLLKKLVSREIISPRLAACLLMVDYTNPVYSSKRAALQAYIPESTKHGNLGEDLDEKFIAKIMVNEKHQDPATPEGEFYSYWQLASDARNAHFSKLISTYMDAIRQKIKTQAGFNDLMFLAESRRENFRKTPQFEFRLTFATNTIPKEAFPLEMTPEGDVRTAALVD